MRLDHARRVRGLAARVAAFALVFGLAAGCNALLGMTDVTERSAAATSSTTASMGDGGPGGAGGAGGSGGGAGGATGHCPPKDVGDKTCPVHFADCSGSGPCTTNLQSDEANCGSCTHDCLGGACVQGTCAEVAFSPDYEDSETVGPLTISEQRAYYSVSEPGGASIYWVSKDKPSTGPATLAAHDFGEVHQLAVYVDPQHPDLPLVSSTSLKGKQWCVCGALAIDGTTDCSTLLQGPTVGLAMTQDWAYVAELHRIVRCQQDCSPLVEEPGTVIRAMLLDGTNLYWSTYPEGGGADQSGQVHRASLDGGDAVVLADGLGQPGELAADDTSLYFTDSVLGSIARVDKKGGKQDPEVIQDGLTAPDHLALSDGVLYFSALGGVYRLPLCAAPGKPERLMNDPVGAIVASGPRVFVTDTHTHQVLGFAR